ncbi:MAG: sulfatase-like hydrolase/transferase [Chloroflexota bacterium]
MKPQNLLYIISDEHTPSVLGCYGNSVVQTPNLDRLAASGTRFTNAYTPCPMCVPTRASLATGQYVHQLRTWGSTQPYDGYHAGLGHQSWGHRLRDVGHRVTSIGKLHFRELHERNGFSEEILPMHIVNGVGWVKGLLRDKLPSYAREAREYAEQIGPGESSYTDYDRRITRAAKRWLEERADENTEKPWVLFLSFVCPHYPLYAPEEFYALYDPKIHPNLIEPPYAYAPDQRPTHPFMQEFYNFYHYDPYFTDQTIAIARASYYALCTFLDDNIGQVLKTLQECGLAEETRVIYTSDHGDMLGNHGQWTKMSMYEDSVGIPFIMSGEGIPSGVVIDTPISLVDSYPTIVASVGETLNRHDQQLPGDSLFDIIQQPHVDRVVFSEIHDGLSNGFYMIRMGDWKYVYYIGHPPQLFNMVDDPRELSDLGQDPDHAHICQLCESELRNIIDPEAANAQAHADQAQRLAELGGVETVLTLPDTDFGFTPLPKEEQ